MKLQIRDQMRDKQIIKWRKQGLLYKEIAEMLGVGKSRVGQLYRRIMREQKDGSVAA